MSPLLGLKMLTKEQVRQNLPSFEKMQGYPVINHGKKHVWLGLVPLDDFKPGDRNKWLDCIAKVGMEATKASDLYESYIRKVQQEDSGPPLVDKPDVDVVRAVGLSSQAYSLLGIDSAPGGEAFCKGFAERFSKRLPKVDQARFGLVVVLASWLNDKANLTGAGDEERAEKEIAPLKKEKQKIENIFGELTPRIHWETGYIRKDQNGIVRDHFGFREGMSQPVFFQANGNGSNGRPSKWDPSAALSYLLIPEPDAPSVEEYGSHMAYVKIRQDTKAFADTVAKLAGVVQTAYPKSENTAATVRGWILGRDNDGKPVTDPGGDENDFDFGSDSAFRKCPASAHIRKVNPRTEAVRNHRVLRRSAFYGREGEEQGALFQCFQSKLETGFEFLFRDWMLNETHPQESPGKDALLGGWKSPPLPSNIQLNGNITEELLKISNFTEIKHGEYFYFPSIPFFRRLAPSNGGNPGLRAAANGPLIPELYVQNLPRAVSFYKAVFQAAESTTSNVADAGIARQELTLGGHTFVVCAEPNTGRPGRFRSPRNGCAGVRLTILVDDVQALVDRAVEYGVRIARRPRQSDQELTDPFGHEWLIRQQQPSSQA